MEWKLPDWWGGSCRVSGERENRERTARTVGRHFFGSEMAPALAGWRRRAGRSWVVRVGEGGDGGGGEEEKKIEDGGEKKRERKERSKFFFPARENPRVSLGHRSAHDQEERKQERKKRRSSGAQRDRKSDGPIDREEGRWTSPDNQPLRKVLLPR